MIVTEDEAISRLCPVQLQNYTARARAVSPPPSDCLCVGSQCMAWIWITAVGDSVERKGCCGLAHTRQGSVW